MLLLACLCVARLSSTHLISPLATFLCVEALWCPLRRGAPMRLSGCGVHCLSRYFLHSAFVKIVVEIIASLITALWFVESWTPHCGLEKVGHHIVVWRKLDITLWFGESWTSHCGLEKAGHHIVVCTKLDITLWLGESWTSHCGLETVGHHIVVWRKLETTLWFVESRKLDITLWFGESWT